jgi:hypothetical protein
MAKQRESEGHRRGRAVLTRGTGQMATLQASLLVGCLRDRGNYHAPYNVITRQIRDGLDGLKGPTSLWKKLCWSFLEHVALR